MNKLLTAIALLVILAGCTAQQTYNQSGAGNTSTGSTGSNTEALESIDGISTQSLDNLTSELQNMSFDEFGGLGE